LFFKPPKYAFFRAFPSCPGQRDFVINKDQQEVRHVSGKFAEMNVQAIINGVQPRLCNLDQSCTTYLPFV